MQFVVGDIFCISLREHVEASVWSVIVTSLGKVIVIWTLSAVSSWTGRKVIVIEVDVATVVVSGVSVTLFSVPVVAV